MPSILRLTRVAQQAQNSATVLNTPQKAASAPDSLRGIFTSTALVLAECWQGYKTRKGKTVSRLSAVFKHLAAPEQGNS